MENKSFREVNHSTERWHKEMPQTPTPKNPQKHLISLLKEGWFGNENLAFYLYWPNVLDSISAVEILNAYRQQLKAVPGA